MATKYSLQKDALEEACQELPQHFNSQREQSINTATDKQSTGKKRFVNSIRKPQMSFCFLRLRKSTLPLNTPTIKIK